MQSISQRSLPILNNLESRVFQSSTNFVILMEFMFAIRADRGRFVESKQGPEPCRRNTLARGCIVETSSRPPLKKNVTWAYFSVSAIRSCLPPAFETTSPIVSRRSSAAKIVVMKGANAAEYSTIPSAAANLTGCGRANAVKPGSTSAVRISRARSARKFAMSTPSPSFIPR